MIENTNITLADLSQDEIAACRELVEKMRAAKKKTEEEIKTAKARILSEVNKSLDKIGIEETKKIIREINRNLRYGDLRKVNRPDILKLKTLN